MDGEHNENNKMEKYVRGGGAPNSNALNTPAKEANLSQVFYLYLHNSFFQNEAGYIMMEYLDAKTVKEFIAENGKMHRPAESRCIPTDP